MHHVVNDLLPKFQGAMKKLQEDQDARSKLKEHMNDEDNFMAIQQDIDGAKGDVFKSNYADPRKKDGDRYGDLNQKSGVSIFLLSTGTSYSEPVPTDSCKTVAGILSGKRN